MPERPRLFLLTKDTLSTTYVDLLEAAISNDAEGISFLSLAIDPDPNALYEIHVAKILDVVDVELTAMWSVVLEHLSSGVYRGFNAGDKIVVRHRSTVSLIAVKTGVTLAFNEVVKEVVCK